VFTLGALAPAFAGPKWLRSSPALTALDVFVHLWRAISYQKLSIQFMVSNSLQELRGEPNLLRMVRHANLGQPYSAVTHGCNRILVSKLAKQLGMGLSLFIGGNAEVTAQIAKTSQRLRIQKNIQIPNNFIVQRDA
jgi:hypothetical protein